MKKVWRWTKRIVLGTLAFVVLATGITLGALHTNWGRNRVRKIVEDQLQSTFPGSTIGKIDGSVLGDLIARDVTIMGRDKRPLVTIKKVTIEAALLPLASKTARVTKIDAEDVVVYAHDQGPPPPEKPPEPSTPSEPSSWSVELPAIHAHGRIEIETATGVERIDDLDTMVALSLRSGEPLKASVDTTARWRNQDLAVRAFVEQGDSLTVQYALVTLGSARVLAANAHVDGTKIDGNVFAFAPAALVKQLAQVDLPGNAVVFAQLANTGHLTVDATVGAATARVLAKADLETKAVHAIVTADVPDLAAVVPNRQGEPPIAGSGTVVATVVATPDHVDGIVTIAGEAPRGTGNGLIAISATRERARVLVAATAESPPSRGDRQAPKQDLFAWRLRRLGGSTLIERANDGWFLREGTLEAAATGDAGEVTASLSATGALSPTPSLAVQGTVDGRSVRYNDTAIASLHTRFAATEIPARPTGDVSIEVNGLRQGTLAVPVVTLAAHGTLHEDGTIDVDLDRHRVRTADGQQWGGNSGHVRVTEQSIAATQLVTSSGKARITAQAQIGRTSDALTAKLTARDIAVATLDPTLQGTLGADVDVSRRDGMWKGTATIDANQIVVPNRPVLDGKLAVKIDKRRVTAVATASNPAIGSATLDLDVIGPRDITDPVAWQRLERSAIQRVRIALSKIDASKLGASGKLDGELAISAIDAGGKVDVKGVVTDVGTLDSQLALAPGPGGEIAAHGTLQLGGVDPVDVNATLALPIHPFDPRGWKQLGRATLREATVEAKRIAFDPDLMKRFGVDSPWRGWAAVNIKVGPEARTSEFVVDVHELRDGPLKKPVDLHIAGGSDANGPHITATAKADKVEIALAGKSPLSVEAMLAGNARTAPIEATLTVPKTAARELALLVGRDDVLGGLISGEVTVGGTIDKPTARAVLAVDNLAVSGGVAAKPPTLEKLELDARWLGVERGFELEVTGHEPGGRLLKISARGKPSEPEGIVASIEAGNFDIAPFVAFAPPTSMAIGTRGQISGVLKLKGIDPNTGDVKGRLVISNARVPLAPELGNLRSGTVEISVLKKEVVALIDGKLGRGTVKGKATVRLTGSMPTAAELSLTLRKISLIGEVQPQIDADVSGYLVRTKTKWTGTIKVANGNVYVPPESGNELLVTGTPSDIVFIDAAPVLVKPKRRPPTKPWLIATIDIGRTKILVDDQNFRFEGAASGQLKLELGDGIGLDGSLSTERGRVDVLGRGYQLDHGIIDFDGTLDPRLDIQMMHSFTTLALTVEIGGRSSQPDLRLSSDSGAYSQGQLLGFLAGGTPSDDPSQQSSDALASGSLTLLSSRLGRKLNRVPFIKFDTINYEAKTASSSRAIRFGKRLGEHTYLNLRKRFEPRLDENSQEATVEHELRKDVLIEATGGERGAGADLLWRKRW